MTYSDCWIATIDDADFQALLSSQRDMENRERLDLLPHPPANDYWINIVHRWAGSNQLPVKQSDPLEIEVAVSRAQLLQFLNEVFWRKEEARVREERETLKYLRTVERVERVREHALRYLRDDKIYLIVADEF